MSRDWGLGIREWGDGEVWGERGEIFLLHPPTPPTPAAWPMPYAPTARF